MDTGTVVAVELEHGSSSQPQGVFAAMEERMHETAVRMESHAAMTQTRIHRFPRSLRGIGGEDDDRYVVPSVVAIGPYHHGLPHLQEMEEVKHAAAHWLCAGSSGRPARDVYDKVLSVAGDARRCYVPDAAVARLGDAEFAAMMFLDGCFLLQYMADSNAPVFAAGCALSSGPAILRDMMLLENQIPWLVLEVLTELIPGAVDVRRFIARMGDEYFLKNEAPAWSVDSVLLRLRFQVLRMRCRRRRRRGPAVTNQARSGEDTVSYQDFKPPHLLGLLRYSQIHTMPSAEATYRAGSSSSLSSSAVELAQIGVKLAPSTATWLGDMKVGKRLVFGELSLSPLFLNDVTACWLVNMAALEATTAASRGSDGFIVSSYLSVVAMLMDRKEDVHELRSKAVLHSLFSNTQTLAFFKGLGQRLRLGDRYVVVLEQIEAYKRNRPVRIVVHSFLYKNSKIIAAVLSIAGVIAGIFKALFSLQTGRQPIHF